jgi:TPR repeat protein
MKFFRLAILFSLLFLTIMISVSGLSSCSGGEEQDDQASFTEGLRAYNSGNYALAKRKWTRLGEKGDVRVQLFLAQIYLSKKGERNDVESVKWLRKAGQNGESIALLHLGLMYQSGRGVPKDYRKAAESFGLAAKQDFWLQGVPEAQILLGDLYLKGNGIPKDPVKAAHWYQKAAPCNPIAQYKLAVLYSKGEGVRRDHKKAMELFRGAFEGKMWESLENSIRERYENMKFSYPEAYSLGPLVKEANYKLTERLLDILMDSLPQKENSKQRAAEGVSP